jgi:diguanylate cyclase (GGDEF)-like protein/PAS domain S-box-containing protein
MSGRRRPAWAVYLAAGLATTVGYYLLPSGGLAQGLVFVGVSAALPIAIVAGVRTHSPRHPRGWYVLVAAWTLNIFANGVWYLGPILSGRPLPYPSVADALFITAYVLAVVGLGMIVRSRGRNEPGGAVDALMVTLGISVLSWIAVIEPTFTVSGLTLTQRVLSAAAYPLIDLALIGMAVRLGMSPGRRPVALWFLASSILSQTAADTLYSIAVLEGSFSFGGPAFAPWLIAYVMLGVTALHPSMRELAEPASVPDRPRMRARLGLLAIAAVAAPLVGMARSLALGRPDQAVLGGIAAVLFVLAFVRMRMLLADVSELRRTQKALGESESRYRTLVEQIPAVVYVDDDAENTSAFYVSPYYEEMLGYTPEERMADPDLWVRLLHPEDKERVLEENRRTMGTTEPFKIEYRMIAKDGRVVWVRDEGVPRRGSDGSVTWQGVLYDITERKVLEEQLAHQAFYDPLTGLANRALFADRLQHSLDGARRRGTPVTVLIVDVDGFKAVNDTMGHAAGDRLLKEVGQRLHSCLRTTDTASRLGGDEFAILLPDVQIDHGVLVAKRILESMTRPFQVEGREVFIDVSIGVAEGAAALDVDEVMRNADAAMYAAKEGGKGSFEIFRPTLHADVIKRMELGTELRWALEHRQFTLHYQPIVTLPEGRIEAVEALVRWEHPERGRIWPADFIPVAEETGLVTAIDRWVLEEACRQIKDWRDRFGLPLSMHVNVSARDLQREDLLTHVTEILGRSGPDPEALVLEITEGALLVDAEGILAVLQQLKHLGVGLAIDDFGVGFSSLSYLRRLDVDVVKIDRSFVAGIADNTDEWSLVRGIIKMVHGLGRETVAEGIETPQQVAHLRALGCRLGQGYLFARPMPADQLEEILARGQLVQGGTRSA